MGAALPTSGVQASGICPSPASSPEVGSKPTQPAPGRYTSAQACRSVKSLEAPPGPFERLHVGRELDQVAGNKAGREAQVAQDLHQQPGRVTAGTSTQGERLLACLHPVLESDDIADLSLHPLVQADQEIQRWGADARHLG